MSPRWLVLAALVFNTTAACTSEVADTDAEQEAVEPNGHEGEDRSFAPASAVAAESAEGTPTEAAEETPSELAGTLLAREAARQVTAMRTTSYEHTTFVDEATGTFEYDCSGFVGYALGRVLPAQLEAVTTFGAVVRPLAKHYQTFFASIAPGTKKSGWSRVARAIELRPGDVVAWLTPPELASTNTGHVMIVTGPATINPKRADEVLVPITDSTSSFHGGSDTRYPDRQGLGRGAIGIVVDSAGAPVRYRWTGGVSAKEYSTPISFARPA